MRYAFKFSKWRQGNSHAIQTALMDTQFSLNKLHATIQISYQIGEALFPSCLQPIV